MITVSSHQLRTRPEPDWGYWVSATQTRNWMQDDPVLDWLEIFGALNGFSRDSDKESFIPEADFRQFIVRKGQEFEAGVMRLLDAKLTAAGFDPILVIAESSADARSRGKFEATVAAMAAGVPVIGQAVVWDWERGTYGIPDLLVRSDLLPLIPLYPCSYPGDFDRHYVVVDVKFKGVGLDAKEEASNEVSHYKAQLALYNAALGEMQGFTPPCAFLLGRGWKKGSGEKKEAVGHCFDRLIPVSLPRQKQFRKPAVNWHEKAMEAVDWIRRLRAEGQSWQVLPQPTHDILRPNMKHGQDAPWHGAKKMIAEAIGEPTLVWELGIEQRNTLLPHGLGDWRSEDFNVELALKGDKSKADRMRTMLHLNRAKDGPLFLPSHIDWVKGEWAEPEALEFFVDFETTSNLDDDFTLLPESGGQPLIFMIGCGHYAGKDQQWVFRVFYTESLTEEEEKRIVYEWYQYMEQVRASTPGAPGRPKVFHWSPAETRTYSMGSDSAFHRHLKPMNWPEPNWYDFLGYVVKQKGTSNALFVKGSWGFGIKAIGKSLHKHGFIETLWSDGPADGLAAMSGSWTCYHKASELGIPVLEVELADRSGVPHRLFQEVIDYNEIDCKVMAESIRWIRSL